MSDPAAPFRWGQLHLPCTSEWERYVSKTVSHNIRPRLNSAMAPAATTALRCLSLAASKVAPNSGKVAPNASYASSPPTAPEVLANYTRGAVLFGRPGSRLAPFVWASLPIRSVITKETARVPERLRRYQRRSDLKVRLDEDFETIIRRCGEGRHGWLTPAAIDVYLDVHRLGFAVAVGTYRDDTLVGGLWGLAVGGVVSVYSLFHSENHAGAFAFAELTDSIINNGRWSVIDCGIVTENTNRYGATTISRDEFCELVWNGVKYPGQIP
jgi:leucyl/phenylalanyl-tRNA---protein transferase